MYIGTRRNYATESGSMSWMSPNICMETTTNGGLGSSFGRMLAGEAIFQNRFTAVDGVGHITFASSFPGSIKAFHLTPGHDIIVQKKRFSGRRRLHHAEAFRIRCCFH